MVRLLLQQPNIDIQKNPDGYTYSAIGMATDNGHNEIVQLLNHAGAQIKKIYPGTRI